MRKYIPLSKKFSYQRIKADKVIKAIQPIVDNVKISSLSAVQKLRFKKQFISDCKNKNIGNTRGDDKIDQKGLERVFKKALDRKTIPEKWITKRYSDLLTKGGTSLSSKWETAPGDTSPKVKDPEKTQKPSRLEAIKQGIKNKELKVMPVMSGNKTSGDVSQIQQGQGAPNKQTPNSDSGAKAKDAKGPKTQPQLRSGGKDRSRKPVSASSMSYNFSGMGSKFKTPQGADSGNSDEFASEKLYKALRFRTPKETVEQKSLPEEHDWRMAAYETESSDSSKPQSAPESAGTQNKDIDD